MADPLDNSALYGAANGVLGQPESGTGATLTDISQLPGWGLMAHGPIMSGQVANALLNSPNASLASAYRQMFTGEGPYSGGWNNWIPYNPSTDPAAYAKLGHPITDPNNYVTLPGGLTFINKSQVPTWENSGDFLSKYGPALASLAFAGAAGGGLLPGAGTAGLVGGASSELGTVGGASGGASLASGGGGLVGGAAGGALAGAAGGGAAIAPTQILGISPTPAAPSTIGGIPTGGAEMSTGTAAPVSAAPSAAAPTASAPVGGLTGGASGGTLAGAIGAVPAAAGADSILQQILNTAKDVFNSPILKGVSEIGSVAVPAVLGAKQLQQSADLQNKALDLQQQQIDNTQPALDTANQALQEYAAGTISPSQQAAIDDWTQQASAQLKNAYAKMGLTGSSMEASALAQIAQKGAADKAQFVQQNFSNAMQALGLANNVYSGITQSELQSSQGMQNALTALGQALGNASAKLAA